jgi:hypothetical protein
MVGTARAPQAITPIQAESVSAGQKACYYNQKPRTLKGIDSIRAPLLAFKITEHQQHLLERLAVVLTSLTPHLLFT